MFTKEKATRFGVTGQFWVPIEILVEPHGSRVNVGLWATKADYESGKEMLEKRTFFFGGEDNPFPLTDNAIKARLKTAIKKLPEFSDAVDDDN